MGIGAARLLVIVGRSRAARLGGASPASARTGGRGWVLRLPRLSDGARRIVRDKNRPVCAEYQRQAKDDAHQQYQRPDEAVLLKRWARWGWRFEIAGCKQCLPASC